MPTKIFIANISETARESDLIRLFKLYGQVVECIIVQDKGYGFVHMSNEEEANYAVDGLNGASFAGRRIKVELSTKNPKKHPVFTKSRCCLPPDENSDLRPQDFPELPTKGGHVIIASENPVETILVSTPLCDICTALGNNCEEATSKCLDCNKLLCHHCVEHHSRAQITKNHRLLSAAIEKHIECKDHRKEVVRFYCHSCQSPVCILCTLDAHKDHELFGLREAVDQHGKLISDLLGEFKDRLASFESLIETVNKWQVSVHSADQQIVDVVNVQLLLIQKQISQKLAALHEVITEEDPEASQFTLLGVGVTDLSHS